VEVFIVQFTDIHSIYMEELNKTSEKPQDVCWPNFQLGSTTVDATTRASLFG